MKSHDFVYLCLHENRMRISVLAQSGHSLHRPFFRSPSAQNQSGSTENQPAFIMHSPSSLYLQSLHRMSSCFAINCHSLLLNSGITQIRSDTPQIHSFIPTSPTFLFSNISTAEWTIHYGCRICSVPSTAFLTKEPSHSHFTDLFLVVFDHK